MNMQYHRMRKKDTLERLSADYGVPICMIVRANGGQLRFQPGDLVAIPPWHYCINPNDELRPFPCGVGED
jgi:hypothetical protein